jgi:hypothetical protein
MERDWNERIERDGEEGMKMDLLDGREKRLE